MMSIEDSEMEIGHLRILAASLNKKRKTGENSFTDVIIECKGSKFPAHKCILSVSSKFLSDQFDNSPGANTIELDVLEPIAVEVLLDFMYTGKINIPEDTDPGTVLGAAVYLQLDFAIKICSEIILKTSNDENIIDLIILADYTEYTHILKKAIEDHIASKFTTFHQSFAFKQLPLSYFESVISHSSLNCSSDVKFEAVKLWVQFDPDDRGKYIEPLLSNLQISDLSLEYLKEQTEDPFILSNVYLMRVIMKEFWTITKHSMESALQRSSSSLSVASADCNAQAVSKAPFNRGKRSSSTNRVPQSEECEESTPQVFLDSIFKLPGSSILLIMKEKATTHLFGYSLRSKECAKDSFSSDEVPLPSKAAVTLVGDVIYLIGGINKENEVISMTLALDIRKKKFEKKESMKTPRYEAGITSLDNRIYVIGGFDDQIKRQKSVECYNMFSNAWKRLSPMHIQRQSPAVCAMNRSLYVIGGYSTSYSYATSKAAKDEPSVLGEKYDITANQWTKIGVELKVDMPVHQKIYHIEILDGNIYILRSLAPIKQFKEKRYFYKYSIATDKIEDMSFKMNFKDAIFMGSCDGNLHFVDNNGKVIVYSVKNQKILESNVIRYSPFLTKPNDYYAVALNG